MIKHRPSCREFLRCPGVPPHLGRVLTPNDDRLRNGHPLRVLQYNFWQKRLAAGGVVGSTIRLNASRSPSSAFAAANFEGTDVGFPPTCGCPS